MKCDNCQKEDQWLEMIGANFICKRCISKHSLMGKVQKTHINTFRFLMRKLQPENYESFMDITNEQILEKVNVKKLGIKLKTTNVIEIE